MNPIPHQTAPGLSRRGFLQRTGRFAAGCALLPHWAAARGQIAAPVSGKRGGAREDPLASIEREVVWNGRKAGKTWFQPRACLVPSAREPGKPVVLMTLQEITGSDVYGQVHWTLTTDLGRTWRDPEPIPAFGRSRLDGGLEEGVCDVVPQFHPASGVVLALGHNVYYRAGLLAKPQEDRFPVYAVRTADGRWSERKRLMWDDPRGSSIYTCGCGERVVEEDGDIRAGFSFAPKGRAARSVTGFRCAFDGRELSVKQVGNELANPVGRGLLEPSLARWGGEYFLTLRAEDECGYVTRSGDGVQWARPQPWTFEDGEPLVMSSTQQHWLPHSDRLHLVYTRRTDDNAKVMRWRSPVFTAAVDARTLRLIRATERVVFPLDARGPAHAARMGNFHPLTVSPAESWVTTGQERPAGAADGWKGDLLLARIRWSRPNAT